MRTLHAHQQGCPCPSRVATDAHVCGGEAERPWSAGSSRHPPPPPAFAEWKLTTPTRRASSASPVTHLDFLCHVAGGWTWPSAPGGCMWVLSSRTEGCQAQGLCGLRVCALLGCVGGHSICPWGHTGPSAGPAASRPLSGQAPPTPPNPGRVTRAAARGARPGLDRTGISSPPGSRFPSHEGS